MFASLKRQTATKFLGCFSLLLFFTLPGADAATISTILTTTIWFTSTPTVPQTKLAERATVTTTLTSTKPYGRAATSRVVTRTIFADSPLPTITYLCDNLPRICDNAARSFGLVQGVDHEVELYYDASAGTNVGGNKERRVGVCSAADTLLCKLVWGCDGRFSHPDDWPTTCDESPPAAFLQGGVGARTQCASFREQSAQGRLFAVLSTLYSSDGMAYGDTTKQRSFAVKLKIQYTGYVPAPAIYGKVDVGGAQAGALGQTRTVRGQIQGHTNPAPTYLYNGLFTVNNQQTFSCSRNTQVGASATPVPPPGISPGPAVYASAPQCVTAAGKRDYCVEPNGSPPPGLPTATQPSAPLPTSAPPPSPAQPVTTGGGGGAAPPITPSSGGPPIIPPIVPVPGPNVPPFGSWNGGAGVAGGTRCVTDGATHVIGLRAPEASSTSQVLCYTNDLQGVMEAAEKSGFFRLRRITHSDQYIGFQTAPQSLDGCPDMNAIAFTNLSDTTWAIDCDTQRAVPFFDGKFEYQGAVNFGFMVSLATTNFDSFQCYAKSVKAATVYTDAYWQMYSGTTEPKGSIPVCSGFPPA